MEKFDNSADTAVMNKPFDQDAVVKTLQRFRSQLEEAGVEHLALFGSLARGDADGDSDIDLAADYNRRKIRTLLDTGAVAAVIADALGTDEFDLADRATLRPSVLTFFDRDHVPVF